MTSIPSLRAELGSFRLPIDERVPKVIVFPGRPTSLESLGQDVWIMTATPRLVGDEITSRCLDGSEPKYLDFDFAASTGALSSVAEAVTDFLPYYASVHRGAGYKSIASSAAYESARHAVFSFARRDGRDDVVILVRNTTEAINHLAYRLRLQPSDVVVTTVVEHHANLLPWGRVATRKMIECDERGTFTLESVLAALDSAPTPKLLAITGASNVTGWMPPIEAIIAGAHARGVPVLVDAAQLAPHRALPSNADYVVFSGHKMYAPFGCGALIGPRSSFAEGDPFLVGGGAVDLVDLDEVVWTAPPEREEAGSPNVIGAVALHAAINELSEIGFDSITAHDDLIAHALRGGLRDIAGVHLLGPDLDTVTLPVASFTIDGVSHALVAARLSAEFGIGVRHGCFCAHPYLVRLLGMRGASLESFRSMARAGERSALPGAVRASGGLTTTLEDVERLLLAISEIAATPAPAAYAQNERNGEWWPLGLERPDDGMGDLPGCGAT
jgi:selenocysteine lyase/cysteine desulfurase